MGDNAIINVDAKGISKVGTALIEKVADGIGGAFRPTQIVRVAKAQAKADLISAQAAVEIGELQRRAMSRFVAEEAKRQSNIEEITAAAIPLLNESAEPGKMDDDWVANFFEKSRIVSDVEMQNLWSKVLAGESNSPGKYAKRTVNLIADLDKADAELFSKLCGFCWDFGGLRPVIFDPAHAIYKQEGLGFDALAHLDTLGLLTFNPTTGFTVGAPGVKIATITYSKKPLALQLKEPDFRFDIGQVLFTRAGVQLAEISGCAPVEGFYEYIFNHYSEAGLVAAAIVVPPLATPLPNVVIPAEFQ